MGVTRPPPYRPSVKYKRSAMPEQSRLDQRDNPPLHKPKPQAVVTTIIITTTYTLPSRPRAQTSTNTMPPDKGKQPVRHCAHCGHLPPPPPPAPPRSCAHPTDLIEIGSWDVENPATTPIDYQQLVLEMKAEDAELAARKRPADAASPAPEQAPAATGKPKKRAKRRKSKKS